MVGLADLFVPEDYDPKTDKPRPQHVPVKPKGELKKLDAGYYRDMPVMDKVSNVARTLGQAVGYSPTLANRMGEEAKTGIGFVPGVGDALGAVEAKESLLAGDIGKGLLQAGLTAIGVVPGVGDAAAKAGKEGLETVADTMAAATRPSIKAYHGSPHSFDKFDMSKIGTGEGAQAYGHGLYFAENEGVAKSYRDTLAKRNDSPDYWEGVTLPPAFDNADFNEWGALGQKMRASNLSAEEMARWRVLTDKKQTYENAIEAARPKGSMYEVNINADPEHFLDWDKPLSGNAKESAFTALTARGVDKTLARYIADNRPGSDVYSTMTRGAYDTRLAPSEAGMPEATSALQQAGIPGIKYLDAGSRDPVKMKELADDLAQYREAAKHWAATGDDAKLAIANKQIEVLEKRLKSTTNYVVFDADKIEIVRRYGIPAALGAGLITEEMARQMQAQGLGET